MSKRSAPGVSRRPAQLAPEQAGTEADPAGPQDARQVWLRRGALIVIAALAGMLYAWAMGRQTLEYYYAAADRSMAMSWHDFLFGAFDPAGTITVDKLPGALWLQALSLRVFGLHTWAIVLPQVVEGVLTVLVLYRAVLRLAGPCAGLIAALALAVSPATVALNRDNISDSLLILLLVLAADAVSGAIALRPDGTWRRLILAGVWVGLAFQAKEIEAWMALPALGLAFLLAGPGTAVRRTGQLGVAAVIVVLVSISWMTAVTLVPAAHRPYVDGSHDNSVFEQVFSYNGFGRFGDQTPVQVRAEQLNPGAAISGPARAPERLLHGSVGSDTGWLIPAAAVVAAWGIVSRRRKPRGDPLRACFVLWGGWLLIFFAVFSLVTVLRPYYTAALAPPSAAIIGAGMAAVLSRDRALGTWLFGLAAIVAGTVTYAAWLVSSSARAPGWLLPALITVGVAATGLIIWSRAARSVAVSLALIAGMAAVLLAPAVASVSLAADGQGAFDTPFESARTQDAIDLGLGQQALATLPAALSYWQSFRNGAPYLMAAQSAALPSLIIYATGIEALPIGGYDGTTPSPTLAQLQAEIRHGMFRLVWIAAPTDSRLRWITAHCTPVNKRLYDCGTDQDQLPAPPAPRPTSVTQPDPDSQPSLAP